MLAFELGRKRISNAVAQVDITRTGERMNPARLGA